MNKIYVGLQEGDEVYFYYNSKESVKLELNDSPAAILTREDVAELVAFLSEFICLNEGN